MSATSFELYMTFNKPGQAKNLFEVLEVYQEKIDWTPYITEPILQNTIAAMDAVGVAGTELFNNLKHSFMLEHVSLKDNTLGLDVYTVKHFGFGVFFEFYKSFKCAELKLIAGHAHHDFDGREVWLYSEDEDIYQYWRNGADELFRRFPKGMDINDIQTIYQEGILTKVIPQADYEGNPAEVEDFFL